jgi:integrase
MRGEDTTSTIRRCSNPSGSATLLLKAGVPAHVVQRRLGHANIGITLDIYASVLPSMREAAAQQLGALLHG